MSKTVTFRRFHRINMDCLRSDLSNCSFVKAPGNAASVLYEQYTNDLKELLDKHTPEVSRTFIKGPAKWRSVLYLLSKAVRRQFELIWRKDKTPENRARLWKQITRCNSLVNRDKSTYYRSLVKENAQDSKKLWQVLRSALHSECESVLPSHQSKECLANRFVTCFSDKITKIRDSFSSSDSFSLSLPTDLPSFHSFREVSDDEIHKVIMKSPTKSCLLDPWPTFWSSNVLTYLYHQSPNWPIVPCLKVLSLLI